MTIPSEVADVKLFTVYIPTEDFPIVWKTYRSLTKTRFGLSWMAYHGMCNEYRTKMRQEDALLLALKHNIRIIECTPAIE